MLWCGPRVGRSGQGVVGRRRGGCKLGYRDDYERPVATKQAASGWRRLSGRGEAETGRREPRTSQQRSHLLDLAREPKSANCTCAVQRALDAFAHRGVLLCSCSCSCTGVHAKWVKERRGHLLSAVLVGRPASHRGLAAATTGALCAQCSRRSASAPSGIRPSGPRLVVDGDLVLRGALPRACSACTLAVRRSPPRDSLEIISRLMRGRPRDPPSPLVCECLRRRGEGACMRVSFDWSDTAVHQDQARPVAHPQGALGRWLRRQGPRLSDHAG